MKIQELIHKKEAQLQQIQKELEALRMVSRMLDEDETPVRPAAPPVRAVAASEGAPKPQFQ